MASPGYRFPIGSSVIACPGFTGARPPRRMFRVSFSKATFKETEIRTTPSATLNIGAALKRGAALNTSLNMGCSLFPKEASS
jgi:hypothetical protein